jgi:predicted Fe-Mo cluster-binding NifX family protein
MLILIPVESDRGIEARITTVAGKKKWALVDFDEGEVKSITFHDDRTQSGAEWIDFVILENRFENAMDFMNEGMMCLARREEETIEEILSAFKFKELDEIGF